jgi:tetratricopeptide (TPR) repeat protein
MTEIMIAALEPRLQKQVESARAAFDRGRPEQALELCIAVLEVQPSCLTVRKLERAAQLKIAATRKSAVSKLVTAVSAAPFLLGGSMQLKDDPRSALATAERLLRRDPQSVAALCLLGQAATALGWPETAVFAHEAASDLEPDRPDVWISLGSAYLAAGRPADAVGAANQALELQSANAEAQTLLRNASVAETLLKGKWESSGDFHEKLHDEPKSGQV